MDFAKSRPKYFFGLLYMWVCCAYILYCHSSAADDNSYFFLKSRVFAQLLPYQSLLERLKVWTALKPNAGGSCIPVRAVQIRAEMVNTTQSYILSYLGILLLVLAFMINSILAYLHSHGMLGSMLICCRFSGFWFKSFTYDSKVIFQAQKGVQHLF